MKLLVLGLLAVVASATHAPHLPELLLGTGMHHQTTGVERTMAQPGGSTALVAAECSTGEIWCSVEAVQPALAALALVHAATWLLGSSWLLIEQASLVTESADQAAPNHWRACARRCRSIGTDSSRVLPRQ